MVQTLRPQSCAHSIDRGYSHPEALRRAYLRSPVPGTLDALLSHGTYVAGAPGYLVCLCIGQPDSWSLRVRLCYYYYQDPEVIHLGSSLQIDRSIGASELWI